MKQTPVFLGTYFERNSVLSLERWLRIIAWAELAVYTIDAGYNVYQTTFNAISGGYPIDFYFIFSTLARVLQGGILFALLQAVAKGLLILMDIEDNTRRAVRAVRASSKES